MEPYSAYLDLRKYGTVPHSGGWRPRGTGLQAGAACSLAFVVCLSALLAAVSMHVHA